MKVGLEIHGYLDCKQKLFCTCAVDPKAPPNTIICPICTAQPGAKPMLPNKEAIRLIAAIGLFLGSDVGSRLLFQRKHYTWPDLPSGYQRTMSGAYSTPTAVGGEFLGIRIREIHIEEDPARWDPVSGLVDYNRSGYPLVELVTEPDFDNAEQVRTWVQHLLTAFSYIKAVNPAAGIKCDVNISTENHPRVEVKNVNSTSGIVQAILHEQQRQITAKEHREQHTRAFDEATGTTLFMRSKEQAEDYRFITEPDLPVIIIDDEFLAEIRAMLPEQPTVKFERYLRLGVDEESARAISGDVVLAELFDKVGQTHDPKEVHTWIRRDVASVLAATPLTREQVHEKAPLLNAWFDVLLGKQLNPIVAKKLLSQVLLENLDIKRHIQDHDLAMQADEGMIEGLCKESISENPAAVADYKEGKAKALNSLVGYVMARTKGKADPTKTAEIMRRIIDES